MTQEIRSLFETYPATVTILGDYTGKTLTDFEAGLGRYQTPGAFQAPDALTLNGTVSATLTLNVGESGVNPTAGDYMLWGRYKDAPNETLTRRFLILRVITSGGPPITPGVQYVPQQATAPDPTVYEGWLDSSTVPPTLKGWDGTSWVAIGGGGSGGVTTFNTRAGAVTLSKADVTGTGLAAADVGADASGAAATAQAAAIAAAATDATTKVAAEATARTAAIATQHTADLAAFDAAGDAATAQAAAISSASTDATTKANAAQAAAIAAAATDATTKANAAQAASQPLDADLTTIAGLDATTAGALVTDGTGWFRKTYAQLKTALGLVKGDVGLGNVDNTSDVNKPVSTAQAAADAVVQASVTTETNRATAAEALLAPKTTTTIDLIDRTDNTTETVPAGTTTNCSTGGVTKTAPALAGSVGTPPLRWAVKNLAATSITVAYPDQAGAAQSLAVLSGETRTFRQKSTLGWGVESGAVALSTLDTRYGKGAGSGGGHTSLWYSTPAPAGSLASLAPAVGTMYAVPVVMPSCTLQAVAVRVITNVASSLIRVGVYADDGTGYPGALLVDAGQISGATAGLVSATISQAVSGLIWLTSVNQTGTPACQSLGDMYYGLGVGNANALNLIGGNKYVGYSMTGVTAALPGTFSTTVTEVSAAIRMAARVA